MKNRRPRYRRVTFQILAMVAGFFALCFFARYDGFTKTEGMCIIAFCSFISFFLGRMSVPDDGEFPKDEDKR
jgi:hypothetical protein